MATTSTREGRLHRAITLLHALEIAFAAAMAFPVTVRRPKLGEETVELEYLLSPEAEELSKALGLEPPLHRLREALEEEKLDGEGWVLTESAKLGQAQAGDIELVYDGVSLEPEKTCFLFRRTGANPILIDRGFLVPAGSGGDFVQFRRRSKAIRALKEHAELLQVMADPRRRLVTTHDDVKEDGDYKELDSAKQIALKELMGNLLDTVLRRARQHVFLHSTFLDRQKFERLLPALRTAAAKGCRIDILWGQTASKGNLVRSLSEGAAIRSRIQEMGLSGSIELHAFSTGSHAKLLVYDDGSGAIHATVGSCNWLYSGFDSFEASVRLRDPRLVADVLYELAEMARPKDGQLPELSVRLAQLARIEEAKTFSLGLTSVKLVTGEEHDDCMLKARDQAASQIMVVSHRLGVTAKPGIIIPAATAARERNIKVELLYCTHSGPVSQADASAASWEYKEQGVTISAVQRPLIHAKMLLWGR